MKLIPRRRRTRVLSFFGVVLVIAVAVAISNTAATKVEVQQLADLLELQNGTTVGEIGAGTGWLTVEVARRVGPSGRVFSTELSAPRRAAIEQAVADAGLTNVTVIEAGERQTNLAAGCCSAIFMRRVYHHFSDAGAINSDLRKALRPGGTLAVIDFEPPRVLGFLTRCGVGIDRDRLVNEITRTGLQFVRLDTWPHRYHFVAIFENR
jgi:protein-L-isoaspartate O-methyltransferase